MTAQTPVPHLMRLFPVVLALAMILIFAVQLRLGRIPAEKRKYTVAFSVVLLALCAITLFRPR